MARKQPESEQEEELPPQGIPDREFTKLQCIGDEKIIRFLMESPSYGHFVPFEDHVKVHYEFFRSEHDKHMMDSLMWEIHRALRSADYPQELGVGIIVNLYLKKSDPPSPSESHSCDELQGVGHEN